MTSTTSHRIVRPAPTTTTARPARRGDAPAIDLDGLTKSFGPVRAVDGLDLRVETGSTVAILGRNGAGKSTTINLLLGLLSPDGGAARIHGRTPEQACTDGLVGAMLQETQPIAQLRVRELLTFLIRLYPNPMRLDELLTLADLTDIADRDTNRLSGGQMQRLKFAMAAAGRPGLLVLDEPTAAMDVEARRAFWSAMHQYAAGGRTVVFTTHYIEEADTAADRIVVIDAGRAVADGSPAAIRATAGAHTVTITRPSPRRTGGGCDLHRLPGVTAVNDVRDRVHLTTTDSDATVTALASAGLVRDLAIDAPTLEDAFVALTA